MRISDWSSDVCSSDLVGRPVEALTAWLESEGITSGPVFLHIDRWENVGERPVSPAGINHMIKRRLVMAGYDETDYSAHGLRAGYLTQAAKRSEAHTSELQTLMRKSYAVFCLKKTTYHKSNTTITSEANTTSTHTY